MKRYIVTELDLNNLMDATFSFSNNPDPNKEWLDRANKECRSIEVPEWATHFAEMDFQLDPYRWQQMEEIPK